MTACKWDRERADYLIDGEPCRRDVDGWPTKHCTAKRSCTQHVAQTETTCGRCINDTRTNLRWIPDLTPLVLVEALGDGVNSEAANLAGPAADYRVFSARRALNRRWLYQNIPDRNLERAMKALLPDDDRTHPFNVLTRWHWDISLAYDHQLPEVMTVADSAAYLDRNLHRIAQDPEQEFGKLRADIKKVREYLEAVIHNSTTPDKGAPCPDCVAGGKVDPEDVRLRREYGHWCLDAECCRVHYIDTSGDYWVCPRDHRHKWTHAAYTSYLEDRDEPAAS